MNSPITLFQTPRPFFPRRPASLSAALGCLIAALLLGAPALATPVNVVPSNLPSCDPLGLAPGAAGFAPVDELGTFGFPPDETISASWAPGKERACLALPPDPDVPGNQVLLRIKNTTGLSFSNLWYVSDPETSISNIDGLVDGQAAFKIDNVGFNKPLRTETGTIPLIFEPGETWTFVIDGYSNLFGLTPDFLASVGLVGDFSAALGTPNEPSSGSIIATVVPEPGTALLMSLGLVGLSISGRRRPGQGFRSRLRGSSFVAPLAACACLITAWAPSALAVPVPLTGSGPHVIEPSPNPDPFYLAHTWTSYRTPDVLNPGFEVFDPPAGFTMKTPWQGNFQHTVGSGISSGSSGLNTFNFSGLNGDTLSPGTLATHSLLSIGDLDEGGSPGTNEWLRLVARDSTNSVITQPWLSEAILTSGTPNGNPDPLPGWTWDGSSYLFDSVFVGTPNPSMLVRFTTLLPIHELDLEKGHVNYGVSFGGQIEAIPEPSTALLVGLGLAGLGLTPKRR
jgi:hypothetical protein